MEKNSCAALARRVEARRKLVEKFAKFAKRITRQIGRVVKREVGSCNIRVVAELVGFANFSFRSDCGQTMFGGNTLEIWYCPEEGKMQSKPEFRVHWQTNMAQCEVQIFDEDPKWQSALQSVIKRKDRIIAPISKATEKLARNLARKREKEMEFAKLEKKAKKLRVL